MRLIYDRVSLEIPYQTLMQGTGPRSALLEEFRATPNAVLFANLQSSGKVSTCRAIS